MSGFAGLLHFGNTPPVKRTLNSMAARLKATGGSTQNPSWMEGPLALTSVGKNLGTQFLDDTHQVVLLYGNLYDTQTLAKRLNRPPNTPPVQLLSAAFKAYGTGMTRYLEGSYSACIWEKRTQTLHLIRDPMGSRPLFWTRTNNRFAFATDLPALIQAPWVRTEIDRRNLAEYLSFRVVHAPRTLLRDVRSLPASHLLRVHSDQLEVRRYTSLTYAPNNTASPKESDLVDQLQSAMNASVRRRLPNNSPAALYLSGGLGSTAIAAAARTLKRKLPSFTISFADDPHPESPFAGRVAKLLGLEHHQVIIGTAQLAQSFDEYVQGLGQPVGNPAGLLQALLAKEVSSHASVAFCGDGSIELFGGRMLAGLARDIRTAERIARLPAPLRMTVNQSFRAIQGGKKNTRSSTPNGWDLELGGTHLFTTAEREQLLDDPDWVHPNVRGRVLEPFYQGLDTDPINAVLNAYIHSMLMEDSLMRSHRTAAMYGVDMRFPLLDNAIVAIATGLPGHSKVQRRRGSLHSRWPLRAMLKGVLPPPLVNRPKRWMPAPLDHWLAGPGRLFMEDRVARLKRNRHGLFAPQYIEQLRLQINTRPGTGPRLWSLFILDAWLSALEDNRLRG